MFGDFDDWLNDIPAEIIESNPLAVLEGMWIEGYSPWEVASILG